jgi:regulation of enolase protein 1 (concanavalin A-like superfamily)/lysophospholipase L1-like esterase
MKKKLQVMSAAVFGVFCFVVSSIGAYSRPVLFPDTLLSGVAIEKTMAKLTSGQAVKIAYFGQSIISSAGPTNWWPDTLTHYLKAKYSGATITATNAAISGYDAKKMIDMNIVSSQLAPLAPDLIVLCIYFHWESQMEALIKQIVAQLPNAEMIILNYQYSLPADTHWNPTAQKSEVPWEDALSWDYLPWLCEKYHFGYLDIRTPWIKYIADFCNGVDQLTNAADGIHLSPQGQWLMAELIKPYFVVKKTDSVQPVIDSLFGHGNKLWIRFSEKVDTVSAVAPSNYVLDGSANAVKSISLNPDRRTIVALVASELAIGSHSVSVSNIKDRAGNAISAQTQKNLIITSQSTWSSCDIGRVFTPGSSIINQVIGEFTVKGGGELASPMGCAWESTDMANRCDPFWIWRNEFQFAYKTQKGDFTLTARLGNSDGLDSISQVGIIVREDLQYLSKFVAIDRYKKNGGYFEYVKRTDLWDSIVSVNPPAAKSAAAWLRLKRAGDTVEAFTSSDGQAWTTQGKTMVPMTDQVEAGLFVCGNEYAAGPFAAKFDNVSLNGSAGAAWRPQFGAGSHAPRIELNGRRLSISCLQKGHLSEIKIHDLSGRLLWQGSTRNSEYLALLPHFNNGVHIISIKDGGQACYALFN